MTEETPAAPVEAAAKRVPDLTPPTTRPPKPQRQEATGPADAAAPAAPKAPKPPKEPKAPKEPKPPKAPKGSRFASLYQPHFLIHLQVKENPKRVGSASRTRFELYKDGMTVGDWVKLGGDWADMSWDVGHGFITVAAPAGGATAQAPALSVVDPIAEDAARQ